MKNEVKPPRKSLFFYYAIMLAVLTLINLLIMPAITGMQVREITYSDFLAMLDRGYIREANVSDLEIAFVAEIDGETYVSDWSNKAYRVAK